MPKDIDDIFKELNKLNKELDSVENSLSRDIGDIKNFLKILDKKISKILSKVEEFEVIMDESELEDDEAEEYNSEWNPYENETYDNENYETYEDDTDNFD